MALIITITQAGRVALVNAEHTGTAPVQVNAVGVTAQAFTPSDGMTLLPGESKRVATVSGGVTAPDTIHVTMRDSSADAYHVRGIGLYLADGTLFAVYGQPRVIAEKSAQAALLMAVDVKFADINAEHLSFGDTNFNLNEATTTSVGVVRLSTATEARNGVDKKSVITPETLQLSRYQPGQIVMTAGKTALPGTLICNGAAVSRTHYAGLYAAIGTAFGAGDGAKTFNLPNVKDGTVITHTNDPASVGTYSAGHVISHTHGASTAAAGDHTHDINIGAAGGHAHGASASAVGDHTHGAWTDAQGWHGHTGGTSWGGDHAHHLGGFRQRYGSGRDLGFYEQNHGQVATNTAGGHAHSFSTDGNGIHSHNIGMNGAGGHSHAISIAAVGDHSHTGNSNSAGSHQHAVSVAATGSTDNLPAGLRMMYCIAY